MKPLIIDTRHYRVVFEYPRKHSHSRRRVKAHILSSLPGEWDNALIFTGEASCNLSAGDKFDLETGRRLALGRALYSLPRNVREKVWESYHHRRGEEK